MNHLERYRNGEFEQVWNELQALGTNIRREPHFSQAREKSMSASQTHASYN
jgi:hypothetical protein